MIFTDWLYERTLIYSEAWTVDRGAYVGFSRNWKNLPPNQRSRPIQYNELKEEVSRKGRKRKLLHLLPLVQIQVLDCDKLWWEIWGGERL